MLELIEQLFLYLKQYDYVIPLLIGTRLCKFNTLR